MNWFPIFCAMGVSLGLLSTSCGGTSSSPPPAQTSVKGTAAKGAPLALATVTLKDVNGTSRTTTTGADGSYTVDTSGLTAPFLVQAVKDSSTLYSVSADANATSTINLTPLTDLIIREWYVVQDVAMDAAFGAPKTSPAPPPMVVNLLNSLVQRVVQLWLSQAQVATSAGFSFISTPFVANGSELDRVLDRTTVNPVTGELSITDGTTTQTSTFGHVGGSITVATSTTSSAGTSTSQSSTVIPTQTAEQTALTELAERFTGFASTVNSKGAALQPSDLTPFIDADGLDDGLDRGQWAQLWATRLKGQTIAFSDVTLASFGADSQGNPVAQVAVQIALGSAGQAGTRSQSFTLRKTSGAWLLYGNRRIAGLEVRSSMQTNQGISESSGPNIEVNVSAPQGTVSGATCSGGGLWSNTPMPQSSSKVEGTLVLDGFQVYNPSLATLPPAGTPFTVVVQPSGSGAPVTYTVATNATTTEAIRITNLTGASLANASLGSPLPVTWTLPTTFPIANVQLSQAAFTGATSSPGTLECETGVTGIGTSTTSGQVNIPTTCNGLPTLEAFVYLIVTGQNGETTMVYYGFR